MSTVHRKYVFHRSYQGRRIYSRNGLLPWLLAAALAWTLTSVPRMHAQQPKPGEYQVKAAYLYNFGRFIEWPPKVAAAKSDSFTICVLGQDPFGSTLTATLAACA